MRPLSGAVRSSGASRIRRSCGSRSRRTSRAEPHPWSEERLRPVLRLAVRLLHARHGQTVSLMAEGAPESLRWMEAKIDSRSGMRRERLGDARGARPVDGHVTRRAAIDAAGLLDQNLPDLDLFIGG